MAQSFIAADLDAYDYVMWFSSVYMLTSASLAPLAGKLATVFSPGIVLLCMSTSYAIGSGVAAHAGSLAVFLAGRAMQGVGGSGGLVITLILVLRLVDSRRRGLFVGLCNAGFTFCLSVGAIVFGALLPRLGWVCPPPLTSLIG